MKKFIISILFLIPSISFSQDTFSIIAVDPETGEVGAAGATCLFGESNGLINIISSIIPGKGGVISQAYVCVPNINMTNATTLMELGYSPAQIITWLNNNDSCNAGNYQYRQYGIIDFDESGNVRTAGYTGNLADDYKEDRQGATYSIQGNILLNQSVIDNMEYNFLNTEGSLAEKLMAAMQGANFPGADERCLDEGTSSATAFLVVYDSDDNPNQPSLEFNIVSQPPGIEPIDLLQEMFDENLSVENSTVEELSLFPNPSDGIINIRSDKNYQLEIYSVEGKIILNDFGNQIDISGIQNGTYFLKIRQENTNNSASFKILKKD
mgnify:FL=1|tara:strand:+ start:46326 stop:47297 length:972 start_codon:yes stop_codon:yes gene_type:complete